MGSTLDDAELAGYLAEANEKLQHGALFSEVIGENLVLGKQLRLLLQQKRSCYFDALTKLGIPAVNAGEGDWFADFLIGSAENVLFLPYS